ncbi:MAG TPA: tRNA (N6-isopentenyl adenosine(37)-C2)-methylthiotransferase MiaB [Gemmatimonadetes bacterium]|nr:tRNA (N6-isopentenyl adenosine(37)-C2)-methylthiotransferase MiaB [Gemmatimonadota bacterium]
MTKTTRSKRAYVETYGCQMNISDGELMEGILANSGFKIVEAPEDADVVLVNTCAIREHAENRVLGRVAQLNGLKRERPELVIGVTGCMAQRMGETLFERAPYVDLVMGPDGYRGLPGALENLEAYRFDRGSNSRIRDSQLAVLDLSLGENYEGLEQRRTEGPTAWIPIQRGCNHRCTFCIVPYVRGPEKNRNPLEILNEVRDLTSRGVTEVTLLGQTVNSYTSMGVGFPDLLSEVAQIEGIRRVRFTSPHPNDVTPELVEVMATEPAVCEHLHLPAQSGNNRTLKRMLRRYSVEVLLEKVEMVRAEIPEIAISTDIIVAFPGETDDEFRDTLELMRTVRFDEAFTYKYSPREGTPATRLPADQFVPALEAQERLEELIEVSRGIQSEINAREIGRIDEVLIERVGRHPGQILGRTRRNKVVVFDGDSERIGCYTHVGLDRTTGATFAGKETDQPELVGQN